MDCVQNLAIYCGVEERIVLNIRNIFDCFGSFLTYLSATKRSILLVFSNGSLLFHGTGIPLSVAVEWDSVLSCFHVAPFEAQRSAHLANLCEIGAVLSAWNVFSGRGVQFRRAQRARSGRGVARGDAFHHANAVHAGPNGNIGRAQRGGANPRGNNQRPGLLPVPPQNWQPRPQHTSGQAAGRGRAAPVGNPKPAAKQAPKPAPKQVAQMPVQAPQPAPPPAGPPNPNLGNQGPPVPPPPGPGPVVAGPGLPLPAPAPPPIPVPRMPAPPPGNLRGPLPPPRPRPPPIPPPLPSPFPAPAPIKVPAALMWRDLEGLILGFKFVAASDEAAKYLEQKGVPVSKVVLHSHPMLRAQRIVLFRKLMVEWYRGWFEGNPFRWIAPSDSAIGWFESFESLNQNRLSLGVWSLDGSRLMFPPSFSVSHDFGNRVIILDNPSLFTRPYAHPPGSIYVLRNWRFQPEVYPPSNPELSVVPIDNSDFSKVVDARHHCLLFDNREESKQLVQITVEGQGVFVDYSNVVEKVNRFLGTINFGLTCKELPRFNGDYGWYVVADSLKPNGSIAVDVLDAVSRVTTSLKEVKTSLVKRDIIESDPFFWWFWGEYHYETLSAASKRSAWVLDLDVRYYSLSIGSSFSSGELMKAVSDHAFIRKYPSAPICNAILRDSIVYWSQYLVNAQRAIRKAAQSAGIPFGNVDENRNVFTPGTSFLCCGNRKNNGFF